ncbi:MAG TPA: BamA/TamA family outer membrane protein [candidate division Zixibacteria bacterium]|nr:BamA/TamA family outer membrane protein [candidate division Zixibacteria bacterium]
MKRFLPFLLLLILLPATGYSFNRRMQTWLLKKPVIDSISISGNNSVKQSTIRDAMYSRKRNAWAALKGDRQSRVQSETLGQDTLEIMYLYLIRGFLDVKIQESFKPVSEKDSAAIVLVQIEEGRRYFYGDKRIAGTYPPKYHGYFTKYASRLKRNEPINPFDIRSVVVEMKTVLSNNGYPYANIQFKYDKSVSSDTIPISFSVVADTLVHFGDISIRELKTGAHRIYPEYVVSRELTFKPGEIYKQSDLVDSRKRLYESGYFSYVQLIPNDSLGTRVRPDMVVQVRETKPKYLSLTMGPAQSDVRDLQWDISAGGGKRNFLGSRHLDLLSNLSFGLGQDARVIQQSNRLRFTEPWFLGIRMPLALTAQYDPPLRFVQQKFIKISSWSLTASTSKRFGQQVTTTAGVEYNKVKITGVPATEADSLRRVQGISVRRDIYSTYVVDSRDNPFIPRRGQYTSISGQFFGGFLGGDDDFYKLQASWSTYQVVWPGWIGAVRLKIGWVKSFGKTEEVPKDELLYLGGANTIRGYKENSLGPLRADGSAEGANHTFIFNQEFRWKTFQILNLIYGVRSIFRALPQWQSVFFDIGNGYRDLDNFTFNSLAMSFGTGFQIVSPAGPIRLDYAIPVRTSRYNLAPRFHFTILYAF